MDAPSLTTALDTNIGLPLKPTGRIEVLGRLSGRRRVWTPTVLSCRKCWPTGWVMVSAVLVPRCSVMCRSHGCGWMQERVFRWA